MVVVRLRVDVVRAWVLPCPCVGWIRILPELASQYQRRPQRDAVEFAPGYLVQTGRVGYSHGVPCDVTTAGSVCTQDSVSRATAFNSSLSQRAAARAVMAQQLGPHSDVGPARPPDAIRRAAYGDAAAAHAEEPGLHTADAASATGARHGEHARAAGSLWSPAGSASGELLPAAARQVPRCTYLHPRPWTLDHAVWSLFQTPVGGHCSSNPDTAWMPLLGPVWVSTKQCCPPLHPDPHAQKGAEACSVELRQETEGGVLLVEALMRCIRPPRGNAASELGSRFADGIARSACQRSHRSAKTMAARAVFTVQKPPILV